MLAESGYRIAVMLGVRALRRCGRDETVGGDRPLACFDRVQDCPPGVPLGTEDVLRSRLPSLGNIA